MLESEPAGVRQLLDNANASVQFYIDSEAGFHDQIKDLDREVQRQQDLGQGYYDSMMTFKKADSLSATIRDSKKEHAQEIANLKECIKIDAAAIERLQRTSLLCLSSPRT